MSVARNSAVMQSPEAVLDEGAKPSPNRLSRLILLSALALVLNAIYNYSVSSRDSLNEMLKVGDSLPAFTLTLVDGSRATGDDFKGKPTAYFFFAEWCPCSHFSVDWIKRSREDGRYAGIGMVAVGVQDSADKLEKFIRRYQLDFPASPRGGDEMARNIGVKVTPTTIFTDSNGVIRHIFVGKIEKYEQLTEGLDAIAPSGGEAV